MLFLEEFIPLVEETPGGFQALPSSGDCELGSWTVYVTGVPVFEQILHCPIVLEPRTAGVRYVYR